jgi:hypothetical protein
MKPNESSMDRLAGQSRQQSRQNVGIGGSNWLQNGMRDEGERTGVSAGLGFNRAR